jgi:DNA-binding transcriptional regulator YiaG
VGFDVSYIRTRCRVDEETGCWHWRMACNKKGQPRMGIGGRKTGNPRRVVFAAHHGWEPEGLDVVSNPDICDTQFCCNPEHLKAMTRKQHIRLNAKQRRTSCGIRHVISVMVAARKRAAATTGMTIEKAREIRVEAAGGLSQSEIARRRGMTVSTVHLIVHHRIWRDPQNRIAA